MRRRGYKTRNGFRKQKSKSRKMNSYRMSRGGVRL